MEHFLPGTTPNTNQSSASTPSMTYITPSTEVEDDPFCPRVTFSLVYKHLKYSTSLSSNHAIDLSQHRAGFLASLEESSDGPNETPGATESFLIRFFQFLLDRQVPNTLILPLVVAFRRDFLLLNDIHSLIASLQEPIEAKRALLCTYYTTILRCGLTPVTHMRESALLEAAEKEDVKLMAIFGGQGASNPRCFRDLQDLYNTYAPFLDDLISTVDNALYELCVIPETRDFFRGREICLLSWLRNPHGVPDEQFLATAAVSFAIHGAVALAHWCVACKVLGKHPGVMRSVLAGTSGHSQGIVVAAAIAASDSWSSFYGNAVLVTKTLFWAGYESHQAAPRLTLTSTAVHDAENRGEGQPSHMLHVSGLSSKNVISLLDKCNRGIPLEKRVYLALSNSRSSFTIAGPPSSLVRFSQLVHEIGVGRGVDQSRIPFDKRKPELETQFLPISSPFHTPYLETVAQIIKSRLSDQVLKPEQLTIPVYDTRDGSNMGGTTAGENILPSLIDAVTIHHVDWPSVLNSASYTHALVFSKGLSDMIASNTDGKGVQIISATELTTTNARFGSKCSIFSPSLSESFLYPQSWEEQFRPRLSRSANGSIQIETKMSKVLCAPPLMVAGMTPTTVAWDFVSAVMNAGYHAELAAGGYFNAETMSKAIETLSTNVQAGMGITCNLIYASPQSMAWQIAMLRRLARTQRPIDGLTIGAGVPSLDVASEYITSLGLRHISFKPGSEDAIEKVLEIAKAHPDFPIIVQWTGGRGGGHHSFEDFHSPILRLYGKIRRYPNVVLVAGSGFGDATGSYPYLTGSWSVEYGHPSMPFDGILLGSRVMVAKEAHTSQAVKQLICNTPGTHESNWTKSYTQPIGGIVTVQSEMGQPIHKVATRGVLFWKEMDDKVFSLSRAKQLDAIKVRKDYIIHKLSEDFAKPWFCRNSKGDNVDLSEMTYLEVLSRLISLMYLPKKGRWIHPSYQVLVHDVAVRILERLDASCEIDESCEPDQLEQVFLQKCPEASTSLIHPEDASWFLERCKRRGQKPVNFVPVIDENLATWMKKDSLWQSEDIESVIDQDPGRVCILQGPVAVKFSQRVDEPVADILNGIKNSWIAMLTEEFYRGEDVPVQHPVWKSIVTPNSHPNIKLTESGHGVVVEAIRGRALPTREESLQYLASKTHGWMRAVLLSDFILQGYTKRSNFLRECFQLDEAKIVAIDKVNGRMFLKKAIDSGKHQRTLVEMSSPDGLSITAQILHYSPGRNTPTALHTKFQYDPQNALYPLAEDMEDRNMQIKSFYSRLWLGSEPESNSIGGIHSTFGGYRTVLSTEVLNGWVASVGLSHSNDRLISPNTELFPLNATIIPAWEALVQPLMVPEIDGDLLRLVHLSIEFELFPGSTPLRIGQTVEVNSHIKSITIDEKGKTVAVRAVISRDGLPVVAVISKFLIQGSFSNFKDTFQDNTEPDMILNVSSSIDDIVLRTRPWFQLQDEKTELVGNTLCFKLSSFCTWNAPNVFDTLRVTGDVFIQDRRDRLRRIGSVDFDATNASGNPVMDFLTRKGKPAFERHELEKPGWSGPSTKTIKMPYDNEVYARVSKDYNPIHVSPIFSTIASLPGTIVHGMYTSAVTSAVLDHVANDFNHLRTRRYTVSFIDMVLPGEEVELKYSHIAMLLGRLVLRIQAFKAATGDKVLEGEAELEQVPTAYIFTGQGSQAPGMGMDLYRSSPVAKKIWDDIDQYLLENYGWSILKMVQENPKRLTIYFSGKRGRAIRDRYLSMSISSIGPDGQVVNTPLLQGITPKTRSFTFEDPKGLLYATQFAQPAIAVLEKAAFEDMRANGLIQEGALFAGHSLGEFGALACQVEFLPFQQQIDIAFYRGLTMHNAVKRDSTGATDFSMVAVNPGRVNKRAFDETSLRRLVNIIAEQSEKLLEIVNFNVEGEQYVCAGHNANLYALAQILNQVSRMPTEQIALWSRESALVGGIQQPNETYSPSTAAINNLIKDAVHHAHELPKPIILSRGQATIPLQGIDVPFHSGQLRSGVAAWRKFLLSRIQPEDIEPSDLLGRFVPNVMGRPFSLDREYIAEAMRVMGSKTLQTVMNEGVVY
ncbi:fatty-acid synthase complex protein [Talaromyces pinophilus]|uniref:Fatty-acid synthase complex protein n=1 Tax=Talaromyces pinophilus TaxID=128442 RepID=A0A6V8HGS2_TALPI|nr:fatty-acid synthase complex protein [Talaromyces pinophilus]